MGYFGGGDGYDADDDEYGYEEPSQRQQRNTPRSPGLRAYMKQQAQEIKALKKQVEEQQAMLGELLEGDSPQSSQGVPHSRLTPEEQLQMQRMQEQGVVGVAAPAGTQAEQIARINAARSPQELTDYLASQGNQTGTGNYNGMGY